jgi:hypothetical protein
MTLKRAYRQEHVPCQLGRSCALKPYILSEQALHFTGTTHSLQNISIAARSPRNRISGVFRGISFACFWPNLANWHAHRVNFIQLWRSRSCVTPPFAASQASPWEGVNGRVWSAALPEFLNFQALGAKVARRVCPGTRIANPGAP